MSKYMALLRIFFADSLSYRGDILLYTFSNIVSPLTSLLLWLGADALSPQALSRSQLSSYFLFQAITGIICASWAARIISKDIRLGKISIYLLRPMSFLSFQAANNITEKISKIFYAVPVIFIFALIFHWQIVSPHYSVWPVFILSLTMAALINFYLDLTLGLTAFWFEDSSATIELVSLISTIFSGRFLPLTLLPLSLQLVGVLLPFRYTLSLPLEIVTGRLAYFSLFPSLALQLIWLILTYMLFKLVWTRGARRYSATGQ